MAMRLGMLKSAAGYTGRFLGVRRLSHVAVRPPPMDSSLDRPISAPMVLPECDHNMAGHVGDRNMDLGFPSYSFGSSIELMAVPKKKVSKHKRGIRNGPKALKPTPVIIRCKSCGRVKLPHFYCCSGNWGGSNDWVGSNS